MQPEFNECDCAKLQEVLYQLLDNELDEEVAHRLQLHARWCADCADALDAQRHLQALVRRCCEQHASSELRARVITRIRQTSIRIERW